MNKKGIRRYVYSSVISPLFSNKMAMRETTGSTPLINSCKIQGFIKVGRNKAGMSREYGRNTPGLGQESAKIVAKSKVSSTLQDNIVNWWILLGPKIVSWRIFFWSPLLFSWGIRMVTLGHNLFKPYFFLNDIHNSS